MEQMRIVKEQRAKSEKQLIAAEGENFDRTKIKPRYMVWENVCFISDTQIMTINGLKSIQDVQVGDQVLTHNHRYMPVVKTYVHLDKEVVRVTIADNSELICTPNHPIYAHHRVSDNMYDDWEFIPAGLLTSEYVVASFGNDGSIMPKAVISVDALSEKETVYNLSVLEDNTYVANGVICHNCGAFSSGKPSGADFQAVLEEVCKVVRSDCPVVPIPKDGWPSAGNLDGVGDDGTPFSICWRLHDAQYWGVPQRRRRIAFVADFGGSSAPEILFEPYSLQGHSKQSTKEGQGTPRDTSDSSGETSLNGLRESDRRRVEEFLDAVNENAPHQQDLIQSDLGVARTLACGTHASGPHLTKTLVTGNTDAKVYGICSFDSNSMKSDNPESGIYEADSARTLDLNGGNPACNQGGMAVVQADVIGCDIYNGNVTGDIAVTVTSQGTGNAGGSGPSVIIKESPKGECLNAWDVQSKHIQPENGIAESLYAGECRYAGGESYVLQNQKEPVLLESNQNHATIQTDGVSTTLPASMGEGGGYVPMVCIEGNGSRDSHKGDGYAETETMYTLNTVEQHAVAYGVTAKGNGDAFINPDTHTALATGGGEPGQGYPCVLTTQQTFKKDSHAKSSEDGQGWVSTDVNDTLNAFDNGETRTPTLVVDQPMETYQNTPVQSMELFHCTTEEDLAAPLKARDYKDPQVVAFEPGASSRLGGHIEVEKTGTLRADMGDNQICVAESKAVESHAQDARYNVGDVNQTLGANMEHDPANGGLVYAVDQGVGKSSCNVDEDKTPTLTTTHGGEPAVCYGFQGQAGASTGMSVCEDSAPTMVANQVTNVTQPLAIENHPNDSRVKINEDGVVQTLSGRMGTGGGNTPMVFENHSQDSRFTDLGETCQTVSATWGMGGNNQPLEVKPQQAVVRRLTPLECTRLQGFPDGWCDIGDWIDSMGKKHKDSDSPKYKALGNSIALPFWDWMAGRMVDQLKKSGVENPTMSSLFDGIAGFPYVYIRHGCMPLWTSEIEEYPIAVCKKHFGDEETGEIGDIEEYLKLPPNWVTDPNYAESYSTNSPIAFDRAAFNQGANAKYDFSVEQDTAQTLVSRGPGGVCQ